MRISLNAGGLGGVAVAGFQADTASLIDQVDHLIIGFVAVKHQTRNLNGGAGQLQGALESMQARINAETARRDAAIAAQKKASGFLALAMRIDGQVAAAVQKNKEEFYQINPWLKPASDKPWHENAWNDICTLWDDTGDFLKKAWDGLMEWCSSNVGRIVLGVLAVVGAVLLVVLIISTGGMALAPLLIAWGVSASVAATISLTVAGIALVSTAVAFLPNTFDLIAAVDEVIDRGSNSFSDWNNSLHQMGWYNTVQRVANITGAVSGGLYSIGSIYNSVKGVSPAELKNFKSQGYTSAEINAAVKQDAIIKQMLKTADVNGLSTAQKGNLGEMIQDKIFREQGFGRISTDRMVTDLNAKLARGIDGVYYDGNTYIVADAKYGTAALKGNQMTSTWIGQRLSGAVGESIADDMMSFGYQSALTQVNPGRHFTPAYSELSFLDATATKVGTMITYNYSINMQGFTLGIIDIVKDINIGIPAFSGLGQ